MDCATCNEMLTCALCVKCRKYYCDVCCVHHRDMNYNHIMFPTQQIVVNQKMVNCNSCRCTKTAEKLCTICWKPFCTLCSKRDYCKNKKIIDIYQAPSMRKQRQKSGDVKDKLIPLYNVSFKDDKNPVRVCGLAYLVDETVVVIDGNNCKLIVFKSQEEQRLMNNELTNEPNAITAMTENDFAVTFPYEKCIQFYKLSLNRIQSNYRVSISKTVPTLGKPFSIAYNQGIFAVEIGEREDGTIGIININDTTTIKTIKCDYAFFTGHTIRLALDKNRVFVSAMGNKMVLCMDVNGQKIWRQSVPSPRATIVYGDYSSSKKILLASKRCNAIYELKEEDQHNKILKVTEKISTPRYMAYDSDTNHLCVLVVNETTHKDELRFFEYKDDEPNKSTSPVGETELQGLMNMPGPEFPDGP